MVIHVVRRGWSRNQRNIISCSQYFPVLLHVSTGVCSSPSLLVSTCEIFGHNGCRLSLAAFRPSPVLCAGLRPQSASLPIADPVVPWPRVVLPPRERCPSGLDRRRFGFGQIWGRFMPLSRVPRDGMRSASGGGCWAAFPPSREVPGSLPSVASATGVRLWLRRSRRLSAHLSWTQAYAARALRLRSTRLASTALVTCVQYGLSAPRDCMARRASSFLATADRGARSRLRWLRASPHYGADPSSDAAIRADVPRKPSVPVFPRDPRINRRG